MRTRLEMARGRGAVEEVMFLSEVMQKADKLQKLTQHKITTIADVNDKDPKKWGVTLKLMREVQFYDMEAGSGVGRAQIVLLEVTENRDVFPSDDLVAQIMLVS